MTAPPPATRASHEHLPSIAPAYRRVPLRQAKATGGPTRRGPRVGLPDATASSPGTTISAAGPEGPAFVREQQATLLEQLQQEVRALKLENQDLKFRLVMSQTQRPVDPSSPARLRQQLEEAIRASESAEKQLLHEREATREAEERAHNLEQRCSELEALVESLTSAATNAGASESKDRRLGGHARRRRSGTLSRSESAAGLLSGNSSGSMRLPVLPSVVGATRPRNPKADLLDRLRKC
eukprot:m.288338 g.288338  ORF g.288338 m.288338 type:complete len:239 (+) comp11952_c0_seq1:290-1006(+)